MNAAEKKAIGDNHSKITKNNDKKLSAEVKTA